MLRFIRSAILGAFVATFFVSRAAVSPAQVSPATALPVRSSETKNGITVENGNVRAVFRTVDGLVRQEYSALRDGRWVPVAVSLPMPKRTNAGGVGAGAELPSRLYDTSIDPEHRFLVTQIMQHMQLTAHNAQSAKVRLWGNASGAAIEQTVELGRGDSFFHIEASATLSEPKSRLEYLLLPLEFQAEGKPDVARVPSFKPTADSVVSDQVFFAPAVYAQKDGVFAALIPDVGIINGHVVYAKGARQRPSPVNFGVEVSPDAISMPTVLDLVLPAEPSGHTVLAYGMMDAIIHQHVWFSHTNLPGAMVRELSTNSLRIGMDLLVLADAPRYRGYQSVAAHHWRRFGSKSFGEPRPQAMPYADYARAFYPAQFSYEGYEVADGPGGAKLRHNESGMAGWQQWEDDATPVGGLRLHAPQWSHFISNLGWWNNVCDATGLYYWGRQLAEPEWVDKARRMVNLALSAPQNQGLFPAIYNVRSNYWHPSLWRPPLENYDPKKRAPYWDWERTAAYQTAAASVTAGYLMQYRRTCEANERILPYVRRYGDFLIARIQTNGCVPAWFDSELRPLPSLAWNADGGAHVWVLSELYLSTHEEKYLQAAKRLAQTLLDEVLPRQRWFDFEAFYSCAVKPEAFLDERTGQWPCNTMSMSWALQGFLALHEATQARLYLEAAEATADFASLFQAVWAPHFVITAYPFGGMSTQLGDAEWLDQRAHRFADPFVRIGLLTGRQDLIERGVAAARSCLTLGNHPRHIANGIYTHADFPMGLGPENVDHEAFPQRPMSSGPSWNTVGGLAGVAHVLSRLGGAYVDCKTGLAIGVDGLKVSGFKNEGRTIRLELEDQLAELPTPYDRSFNTELRLTGRSERGTPNRLSLSWTSSRTGTPRSNSSTSDIKLNPGSQDRQVQLKIEPDGAINVNE